MACSDEDHGRSRRSGTRWPGSREVGWRRVRSAPDTWRLGARVFWLSLKTKVDSFLQFGLKTGSDAFSRFGLKTGGRFLGCASKPRWWRVPPFGP
jgi:hypothetical protein